MCEIKEFGIFIKNTTRRIQKIKNHLIWISIHGEIKEQNLGKNLITKREKTERNYKIRLI